MKSILIFIVMILSVFILDRASHRSYSHNYADQDVPSYIDHDNTPIHNRMNDTIASLGRVLFYDKKLSIDETISCASCHQQEYAFGDTAALSTGVHGLTTDRHAMRLVNIRHGESESLFWDNRIVSLEAQTTEPIKNHKEMGFSGAEGNPSMIDLIKRLDSIDYYKCLFAEAFQNAEITEEKIQLALAQFIRSIQSYDSKYDKGRAQVNDDKTPFPNFTDLENRGKQLFLLPKADNGANCQVCHRAPIFDIDPGTSNNGITSVAGDPTRFDPMNNRSPTLRDLFNPSGTLNGPLMHDGSLKNLEAVIDHYNKIPMDPRNKERLNSRLRTADRKRGQQLNLTTEDKEALIAFLKTLTGNAVYCDEQWSDPFDKTGKLDI